MFVGFICLTGGRRRLSYVWLYTTPPSYLRNRIMKSVVIRRGCFILLYMCLRTSRVAAHIYTRRSYGRTKFVPVQTRRQPRHHTTNCEILCCCSCCGNKSQAIKIWLRQPLAAAANNGRQTTRQCVCKKKNTTKQKYQ